MNRKILILFILIIFSTSNISVFSQDFSSLFPKSKDQKSHPVIVNGDKVEYSQEKKTIVGEGNISVKYGDIELTCEKITVDTITKTGLCEGNVKITQPGSELKGQTIEYNFPQETGRILKAKVYADKVYARANTADKVSKVKTVFQKGSVTTCDLDKPHYRIEAKSFEFYMDEKIVAKHVILYLGSIPVFYIPYYTMPIKELRNKINIVPGYKDNWGYYVLGSYRYYLWDKIKGNLNLDYRTKRGIGAGVDVNYDADELGKGMARYYYTYENGSLAMAPPEGEKKRARYRLEYRHEIDLEKDTKAIFELNKLSDKDIVKDYFDIELDDGWTPKNSLSIITTKPLYSTEINMDFRVNDFLTVVQKLPEARLNVYNTPLWGSRFYYTNQIVSSNFIRKYDDALNLPDEKAYRLDTVNQLSYVTKLFGFLYTTPYFATRYTYYSQNKFKTPNQFRQIYEWGVNFSTKLYRTFDFVDEKANIYGLRHVIAPEVNFVRRYDPSIASSNLYQFDTLDNIDEDSSIILGLENKLQAKRKVNGEFKSVDIIRLLINTSYAYKMRKNSFMAFKGDGKFGNVLVNLELQPFDWLFAKSDLTFNFTKGLFANRSLEYSVTDLVCQFGSDWNVGLGHIYENSAGDPTSQFTFETRYKVNDEWSFRMYQRFDVYNYKWQEQEYTLYKDLHCWIGEFSMNIQEKENKDKEYAFWVVFKLKAYPEIPIGFDRTYKRPHVAGI